MRDKNIRSLDDYKTQLLKAFSYLEYSYEKVQKLPKHISQLDQETLEVWESFSARFARVSDIFISKYVRARIQTAEPGFRGTMLDLLHQAEKMQLISDVGLWVEIRELRNATAHEYSESAFDSYIAALLRLAPVLLNAKKVIEI